MSSNVDLRELAIDRGGAGRPRLHVRRHVLTRYVLPLSLIFGFLSLVAWAMRDTLFPPRGVTVVPVFSTQTKLRQAGTPLFNAAGWIEPRPTPIRVAALAPGVVEALLVVEDQAIEAGEPVAELVKDDAQLAHRGAVADVKLREAELAEVQATLVAAETHLRQPVHLEAVLGEAEAALAQVATRLQNLPFETRRAEADYEAASKDHAGKLEARGVVAGVEIDIAESKVAAARALVEELRDRAGSLGAEQQALTQRRDALRRQLELHADETKARDEAAARVSGARARVEQARVAVAEAELRLRRMTVKAPIDGRVFRLIAHPGARIGSGMTQMEGHDGSTVVTLYRPHLLQVRVDVRFEDVPNVSLQQPVEIKNPAIPSHLTGRVLFIGSEADIQKNTLQVKVEIADPPAVLKPEMLVDVTFLAPPAPDRTSEPTESWQLYVPRQLIQQDDGGTFVWLADQSAAAARKTPVQTGEVGSQGLLEITSGLTVSSRLIVSGTDGLRDGDRIAILGEDTSLGELSAPDSIPE